MSEPHHSVFIALCLLTELSENPWLLSHKDDKAWIINLSVKDKERDCASQQFAVDKILSTLWSQIVTQMFQ